MPETANVIVLKGDKKAHLESAINSIEFPGGNIQTARTSGKHSDLKPGMYWAHIEVNQEYSDKDTEGHFNKLGRIIKATLTYKGKRVDIDCRNLVSINALIEVEED